VFVPLAFGLLSLGLAAGAGAQTDTVTQADPEIQTTQADTAEDDGGDDSGKWGLVGLLGLAGLAGLAKRDHNDRNTGTNR
jgi:MYXO-CTERM domain-containing protein